jgi:hypothetical protein
MAKKNAAAKAVTQWQNKEWDDFQNKYTHPINDRLAELNSTKLVDSARATAINRAPIQAAVQKRRIGRYDVNIGPEQKASAERLNALNTQQNRVNSVNQARFAQTDLNDANALSLSNMGNQIKNQGMNQISQAAGLQVNRNAANDANAAANKAQRNSMIMSGAMMAAMMM